MILIADSHVAESRGNVDEFLQMLHALAQGDEDVVFLGDVLELWIALPRYRRELSALVLEWVRAERRRRRVGLVEGNHEFHIASDLGAEFTFASSTQYIDAAGRLFTHGNRIDRWDVGSRLLRFAVVSRPMRWLAHTSSGESLIHWIQANTGRARSAGKGRKPVEREPPFSEIRRFAEAWFRRGVRVIFAGHFHREYRYRSESGGVLYLVPPWCDGGRIAKYDAASEVMTSGSWRDLL